MILSDNTLTDDETCLKIAFNDIFSGGTKMKPRIDWKFYRYALMLALPIMLQNGVTQLVNLLDNIMIGRLGTEEMSGVAIVNQLIFVFQVSLFGATAGAGIFSSQFHGRGNTAGMQRAFRFKLIACGGFTVLGIVVFLLLGDRLIWAWLHDGNEGSLILTHQAARTYLLIMLAGLPFFALKEVYASTLRETGHTDVPMRAAVAAVTVNLVFNYLLIFGKFGFPRLGVAGGAIATVLSRIVEAAIVIVHTHRRSEVHTYIQGMYRSLYIGKSLALDIARRGLPLLLNELFWSMAMAMMSRCYSERGLDVVAAYNICSAVTNIAKVVFIALGQVAGIVLGNTLGAGKTEEARVIARKMLIFCAVVCSVVGIVQIACSGLLPRLYNTTDEIRDLARWFILIHGIFQPVFAVTNCEYFTIRSGGSVYITMLFDSVYAWTLAIPVTAALIFLTELPIIPIYFCVLLTEGVKAIFGGIVVARGKWARNLAVSYDE